MQKATGYTPAPLKDRPSLFRACHRAWNAFHELSEDRPYIVAMERPVPRQIPFADIARYARSYGISGEAFEVFHKQIRALDRNWIKNYNSAAK